MWRGGKLAALPAFRLACYGEGCPSPTVDLLLVLDPQHNDMAIGRNGDAAYGLRAVSRKGIPVDITPAGVFPAGTRIGIGQRDHLGLARIALRSAPVANALRIGSG